MRLVVGLFAINLSFSIIPAPFPFLSHWCMLVYAHSTPSLPPSSSLSFVIHTPLIFVISQQGATLQNYNNELVKCIEDLREKREEVSSVIAYLLSYAGDDLLTYMRLS